MSRTTALGLALAVATLGCGRDATGPQSRLVLQALSPTTFEGTVASAVQHEPTVLVTDRAGKPLANVSVAFTLHRSPAGSLGSISRTEALTNAKGVASAGEWILGERAGPNLLQATIYGAPQIWFVAKGLADAPFALIWRDPSEGQIGLTGMAAAAPSARVTDRFGNGVAGVLVAFDITAGDGALAETLAVTDDDGVAAVALTLGRTPGANTVTASALELRSIDFTIEGVMASAIYDLTMIDGESLEDSNIESGYVGLTSDGRFVSHVTWNASGNRWLSSRSGTYAMSGSNVIFKYGEVLGGEEYGTLLNGVLLVERLEDEWWFAREWQYSIRES